MASSRKIEPSSENNLEPKQIYIDHKQKPRGIWERFVLSNGRHARMWSSAVVSCLWTNLESPFLEVTEFK